MRSPPSADIASTGTLGFTEDAEVSLDYDRIRDRVKEEIDRTFAPEFLNRLDDVIVFHPLSREQIGLIVYVLLRDLEKRLAEEDLKIRLTEAAVEFLVERGYDTRFGARPLKRTIQRYIEDSLSEKILMAEFAPGDEILVDAQEDAENLQFQVASHTSAS